MSKTITIDEGSITDVVASLEADLGRGLMTPLEYRDRLIEAAVKYGERATTTYTTVVLFDGQRVGGSKRATLADVADLIHCYACEEGAEIPECVAGCASTLFLEDLKGAGKAMMISGQYGAVEVFIAYKNEA